MFKSSVLLLGSAVARLVSASPLPEIRAVAPSYPVVSNQQTLYRTSGLAPSAKSLRAKVVGQDSIYAGLYEQSYIGQISVGSEQFYMILDTGSSDTWLAQTGFTCVDYTNNATISEAECGFASTFTPDSAFQQIPNENFNVSYADLEYLNGIVGYDSVNLAGIQVQKQEIGLAQLAGFAGDNITSGLVGLAYPAITSAFAGTNATADVFNDTSSHLPYSSIINTIFFVENLTDPVFSLVLSRNPDPLGFAGYITIGGIPDVSDPTVNATGDFASTPILPVPFAGDAPAYAFYAIDVDGLVYGRYRPGSGIGATTYVVDSGTTLNYFSSIDAALINSLFDPPAQAYQGLYVVLCNSTAPSLGVTIAGETFYHNPVDLIYDGGIGDGICLSGIQDGGALGAGVFILGDVFMKNVVSVFDVGKEMMSFSAREYYEVPSS